MEYENFEIEIKNNNRQKKKALRVGRAFIVE